MLHARYLRRQLFTTHPNLVLVLVLLIILTTLPPLVLLLLLPTITTTIPTIANFLIQSFLD
jgi:hypothetical protein